jgi:hypothetical protein
MKLIKTMKRLLKRKEEPEPEPGPGISTLMVVGKKYRFVDASVMLVGHIIRVWLG